MAWWRTPSAQTHVEPGGRPRRVYRDRHGADRAGRGAVAAVVDARRAPAPGTPRERARVLERARAAFECRPHREGLPRQPLGDRHGDSGAGWSGPRPGEQDHAQVRPPLVRVDDVFHVEQVDGLTLARRDDDQEPKWKTHRTAERMNPDFTLAVTNTCPKDGVHLCSSWSPASPGNPHAHLRVRNLRFLQALQSFGDSSPHELISRLVKLGRNFRDLL